MHVQYIQYHNYFYKFFFSEFATRLDYTQKNKVLLSIPVLETYRWNVKQIPTNFETGIWANSCFSYFMMGWNYEFKKKAMVMVVYILQTSEIRTQIFNLELISKIVFFYYILGRKDIYQAAELDGSQHQEF